MNDHAPIVPRLRVLGGTAWIALGFAVPIVAAVAAPSTIYNEDLPLAVVLLIAATILGNVKFRLSSQPSAPIYCPVGAPIVLAAITCTPIQAMLLTLVATLLGRDALRDAIRGVEVREWLSSAGLAVTSVPVVALAFSGAQHYVGTPLGALLVGFSATAVYLLLDAAAFIAWMQAAAGAGRDVLAHFRGSAPLDAGLTGTVVVLAVPFHDQPLLVATVLAIWQGGIIAYYRMSTSEHLHREQAGYLRDVFARYVPESVADRLAGREDEVRLGGESRLVSVLFCDIRGFTSWSEQHDAEVVIEQLNAALHGLTEAVMRHDGTLDKFTGDGLMAFWGAPLEQPDHARRACAAAADIHAAIDTVNAERQGLGMEPFAIGVGIATGRAVVGNIGHERRLEYTAIGDTVNLAARLESATKELCTPTVISAPTARLLLDEERLDDWPVDLGKVLVKGKLLPVEVYGLFHGRGGASASGDGHPDVA